MKEYVNMNKDYTEGKKKNNGTMIFKFQGKTISKLKFYAQTKVK